MQHTLKFYGGCAQSPSNARISCRIKRNVSEYEVAGGVTDTDADGLLKAVRQFAVDVAPDVPLSRIRGDTHRPQVPGEPCPPLPQRGFANVQALTVLADRLEYDVDVRVRLIRMQGHGIAMLERELLPEEIAYGQVDLLRWPQSLHGNLTTGPQIAI